MTISFKPMGYNV